MTSNGIPEDLFTNLPAEIIIDILSRLPIGTIMSCKCVCKSWLDLVETREFVNYHLSKSVSGLALCQGSTLLEPFEFVDDLRFNMVFKLSTSHNEAIIISSVNGLLLCSLPHNNLFICNPITRDCIRIPSPPECLGEAAKLGFGVSKMSGKYKIVRFLKEKYCQVYTLGTASWRSIATGGHEYRDKVVAFVNGNLHRLVFDSTCNVRICALDLETEVASSFSPPPFGHSIRFWTLSALGDRLCLCYSDIDMIVIWLMDEYGDEKSWTTKWWIKECITKKYISLTVLIKHIGMYFIRHDFRNYWHDFCFYYYKL